MNKNFELQVPKFENPFESLNLLDDIEKNVAKKLFLDGFCVIDFPCDNFSNIAATLKQKLAKKFKDESDSNEIKPGQRLQDGIDIREVLEIAGNKRVIEILSNVYGRKAFPFQTLNFPSGTEQSSHSDHVHFDSIPHRFMAGVWVALEDTNENNGPLFYYPGSHKWPTLYNTEVAFHQNSKSAPHYERFPMAWERYAKHYGIEKQYFYAKKGQCLIWHSNLVHGGSPHINKSITRWSQVTHYYFDNCAYYTPVLSNPEHGIFHWREIINLITKEKKHNIINGHKINGQKEERKNSNNLWKKIINVISKEKKYNDLDDEFVFDPDLYLKLNPDVKTANVNPYEHYLKYGIKEKRRIR